MTCISTHWFPYQKDFNKLLLTNYVNIVKRNIILLNWFHDNDAKNETNSIMQNLDLIILHFFIWFTDVVRLSTFDWETMAPRSYRATTRKYCHREILAKIKICLNINRTAFSNKIKISVTTNQVGKNWQKFYYCTNLCDWVADHNSSNANKTFDVYQKG